MKGTVQIVCHVSGNEVNSLDSRIPGGRSIADIQAATAYVVPFTRVAPCATVKKLFLAFITPSGL